MRFDSHPRAAIAVAFVLVATNACGFVVSGDEALADEFARFKAAGGRCTGTQTDTTGALANATAYNALVWGALLGEVVAPSGRVRYGQMKDDVEQQETIAIAKAQLADVDVTKLSSSAEKLAFWINAYNTLVLAGAAAGYAADPAFRVDAGGFAFFDRREHDVSGLLVSLNEIEHGVLRGTRLHGSTGALPDDEWAALSAFHTDAFGDEPFDARIHFVLNCASKSCPPLAPFQYRGSLLDDQLEAATSAYVHDETNGAGPAGISELFAFYQGDFDAEGGVAAFIGRYRSLSGVDVGRYIAYDWSLNLASD
jgi:hypothetical protein